MNQTSNPESPTLRMLGALATSTMSPEQLYSLFGQYQKAELVARLRKAREAKKALTGHCGGRHPFGAKPGEQETVCQILALRAAGKTTRAIAAELNRAGIPTRYDRSWVSATVARILRRP